ncbi:MAG: nitroreductase family protein [Spirochaetales bacterium]|nr:nitroreductase family protein [Spirochaetales bacterium]
MRQYTKKDISKEELEKILEVMRYAPSGHNAQPCEYIILKDREMIKMISDLTIQSFRSFRNLMRFRKLLKPFVSKSLYEIMDSKSTALGMEDMIQRYASGEDVIFFDAPAVILVHVPDMGGLSYVDSTIAATYGMLAAHALGIGSCWMGFAMMAATKNKKLFKTLYIPKGRLIAGIFTLGYPKNKFHRLPVRNPVKATWSIGAVS